MTQHRDDDIDDEDVLDLDEAEVRSEVLRRARSEGALAAYESALEITRDKKAPAVARASSQRTLLTLAGLIDRRDRTEVGTKAPSEMSPEELAEALDRLKGELAERSKPSAPRRRGRKQPDGGVFD